MPGRPLGGADCLGLERVPQLQSEDVFAQRTEQRRDLLHQDSVGLRDLQLRGTGLQYRLEGDLAHHLGCLRQTLAQHPGDGDHLFAG